MTGTTKFFIFFLLFLIPFGYVVGCYYFFSAMMKRPAVTILAAENPEIGVPVYAQFTVAQTVRVVSARVVGLQLPLYFPDSSHLVVISLQRADGTLVEKWPVPRPAGMQHVFLPLPSPMILDGVYTVLFDGGQIPITDKLLAPRVFVEPADTNYPDGNYRIAQNEKKGDVAITFMEERSRWFLLCEEWSKDRLKAISFFGGHLLVFLVLTQIPFLVRRNLGRNMIGTNQQIV